MARIPPSFITELVQRTDIVEVIDSRLSLRKSGQNFKACCPFHEEKSPSFTVSPSKQIYHCFGCGESGNAISFLMQYERLNFVESVEQLAEQHGLSVPREDGSTQSHSNSGETHAIHQCLTQAAKFYRQQLRQSPEAIEYLKQRGLSGEICKRYGIGYAPAGWDNLLRHMQQEVLLDKAGLVIKKDRGGYYDRLRHRIIFPIIDPRGHMIGFGGRVINPDDTPKYLNSPETAVFHKGQEVYGLYEYLQAHRGKATPDHILIVEGYMDVVALAQHGINNAIATLGTSLSKTHLTRLLRYTKTLVFCFDADNAGRKAAWRALEISLAMAHDDVQIRFLFLPQGDDPDSFVREHGQAEFQQQIQQAQSLTDYFFAHLSADLDLSQLQQRAQLSERALPLLKQLPQGQLAILMRDELARQVRIAPERLQQQLAQNAPLQTPRTHGQRPSALRLATALLLQQPELIQDIGDLDAILAWELPDTDLFKRLIQLLHAQPHLNTATILEYWREQEPVYNHLRQLLDWVTWVPEAGERAEFQAALQRLHSQSREQRLEKLLAKAKRGQLDSDEKTLLNELISEK